MPVLKQFSCLLIMVCLAACSKKMIPEKPILNASVTRLDSLPPSEIDIPIRINLKPLYAIAEKEVQQVYTSPGFPNDYVVDNCDTRYMYRFRRGPLQFSSTGNSIQMGFTGFYTIVGGQRVCTGTGSERIPVTPWSPSCTCGLREGERKVNVSFQASFRLSNNYHILPTLNRMEPVPIDKCTVCVFGIDITRTVMDRLRAQLDDARKSMLDTLATMDLRPQFQKIWDLLNTVQPVDKYGYLQINPVRLRLSDLKANKDTMTLSIGLTAKPVITQRRPQEIRTVVPELSTSRDARGFSIYTDAFLDYDSLGQIINATARGKRISLEQLGKYVVIEKCIIYGSSAEKLVLKVEFSGSASGEFYLTGRPVYDPVKKLLKLDQLEYDIRSRNMMLRSAEWMFSGKILKELQQYAQVEISTYEAMLRQRMNETLNSEIRKGVRMRGSMDAVNIERIYPFPEALVVRFHSKGNLDIMINDLTF